MLSGSCSVATNGQVAHWMQSRGPRCCIDPLKLAAGQPVVARGAGLGRARVSAEPVLIYATATPEEVKAVQRETRRRARRRAGRAGAGRDRQGPRRARACASWSSPAARPPAPWCGALGVTRPAHRPADRPRRAVDREPRRPADRAGAQVGQFRQRRFLLQGAGAAGVTPCRRPRCASRSASSAGRSSSAA